MTNWHHKRFTFGHLQGNASVGVGEHIFERSMLCSLGGWGDATPCLPRGVEYRHNFTYLGVLLCGKCRIHVLHSTVREVSCEEIHAELTISSGGEWQIKLNGHRIRIRIQYIGKVKLALLYTFYVAIHGTILYRVTAVIPYEIGSVELVVTNIRL